MRRHTRSRNSMSVGLIILVAGVFLLSQPFAFSQAGRGKGRASGEVKDEAGKPVPNIKVALKFLGGLPQRGAGTQFKPSDEITMETLTDKKGKWQIGGLGSGRWQVAINVPGFAPFQTVIYISQFERNPYPEHFPRLPLATVLTKGGEQLALEAPDIELFETGNALFREEKFAEAIASYRAFLAKNPDKYQVHYSIGQSYKKMGKVDEALAEFQIVLDEADPAKDKQVKGQTLTAVAECYLNKEDLEAARTSFQESLKLNPEDEILAYNIGEIYFSNQKLEEALEYFTMASQIKPDWPDAYLKLGYVYVNKADNASAVLNFEKFLELEPDSERAASVRNILDYLKK